MTTIAHRITEIKKEIEETEALKNANKISAYDIENASDNYELDVKWNCLLSELYEELAYLEQVQLLTI